MPKAHVATAPAETAAPHRLAATARRQALTEPRLPRRNKATGLKRIQDRDAVAARARRAAASPERHYKKRQGRADRHYSYDSILLPTISSDNRRSTSIDIDKGRLSSGRCRPKDRTTDLQRLQTILLHSLTSLCRVSIFFVSMYVV